MLKGPSEDHGGESGGAGGERGLEGAGVCELGVDLDEGTGNDILEVERESFVFGDEPRKVVSHELRRRLSSVTIENLRRISPQVRCLNLLMIFHNDIG